jgi:4-carboxymuconolactone decarboxylase
LSDREGRLPLLEPDALDATQGELYASIAKGPRATGPFSVVDSAGRLTGPFNALLHAPAIGSAVEQLGAALRFGGELDARTRELVICAVAAHWDSAYERYAHERVARQVGVTDTELERIRQGGVPAGLPTPESSALKLAAALLRDRRVEQQLYDAVVVHHGPHGLVEICAVVGYYQLLAGLLAAADVGVPKNQDEEESP